MKELFLIRKDILTNEQLKDLLKHAYSAELFEKEKELGRPLSEEESGEIKVTIDFINKYHKLGLLPSDQTFRKRFGSIEHAANLTGLSANSTPELYNVSEEGEYIRLLRLWVKENNPSQAELKVAITSGKIQGVPRTIYKHIQVSNYIDIPVKSHHYKTNGAEKVFSDDDLIIAIQKAFEAKCKQEAQKLGKEKLSPDELQNITITKQDYLDFLTASNIEGPSSSTIINRMGPSWSDVLTKAGLQENILSDKVCVKFLKKAFELFCQQKARKLGRDLNLSERSQLKLRPADYKLLREQGFLDNAPAYETLLKKLGPHWDNVLMKAGLN